MNVHRLRQMSPAELEARIDAAKEEAQAARMKGDDTAAARKDGEARTLSTILAEARTPELI